MLTPTADVVHNPTPPHFRYPHRLPKLDISMFSNVVGGKPEVGDPVDYSNPMNPRSNVQSRTLNLDMLAPSRCQMRVATLGLHSDDLTLSP